MIDFDAIPIRRVYLCGRYGRREELLGYAAELKAIGVEVEDRWLRGELAHRDADPTIDEMQEWALLARQEIAECDTIICFTEAPNSPHGRGGRHVEFGYALCGGVFPIIVGPIENMFYADDDAVRFNEWAEALDYVKETRE